MLTLRQIEVIRAVMVTGTIGGASRLLNVSSPGISRVVKHAESVLRMKLFSRRQGRYVPTHAARDLFNQINAVYDRVEDLHHVIKNLERGAGSALKIASVPSIANVMVPRAIACTRRKFPDLLMEVDILKIEEAIDYLLLGKGEAVAVSHQYDHPMLSFEPLAEGRLLCVVPEGHELCGRAEVTPAEIARHKLIGIDPADPYGGIMAGIFVKHALDYEVTIRARFGSMVCALVTNGLGVAVVDEFTLAGGNFPGLKGIPIAAPARFQTYVAFRRDAPLSSYCEYFVRSLRAHMQSASGGAASGGKK
ncbi:MULTISPECIES: LysR family transcriptional regulator [Rhodomicrobium]|uniref:LysR family transcriptional regulator n=1 Tax=Rhodomicrobium TaxID=1068 RepID=UPI000B4BFE3F|nr:MULTISPECIES: LysR family transcriptional regulator [Rhodomicrobium]